VKNSVRLSLILILSGIVLISVLEYWKINYESTFWGHESTLGRPLWMNILQIILLGLPGIGLISAGLWIKYKRKS